MKQFKEGQIVKATESTYYLEVGEIAEVKLTGINPELCLVFYEGTDRESKWPWSETSPEFFDFYEKIAWVCLKANIASCKATTSRRSRLGNSIEISDLKESFWLAFSLGQNTKEALEPYFESALQSRER